MSEIQIRRAVDSINILGIEVMENRATDTGLTLQLARRTLRLAKAAGTIEAQVKACNIMGNALSLTMSDSAFYYYSKAMGMMPEKAVYSEKPILLYNIAMLNVSVSNHKNALVLLDSALREAGKLKNWVMVSNSLNALGNLYKDLGHESIAKKMFDSAYNTAYEHQLTLQMGISLGSQAQLEKDPAIEILKERKAIQCLKDCKDGAEPMASIYINSGSVMANPDSSIACYFTAIKLISSKNPTLTLLTAYNNLVYSYLEKGETATATDYLINLAFPLAGKIGNDGWTANLYDTYADVLSAEGRFKEAMSVEKKSMELKDRADKKAADKQVLLLGTMLDLKNKEAMTRVAQQESEQTKTAYARARFWFAISILLVLFAVAMLAFLLVRNLAVTRGKLISAARKIILVEENEKATLGRDLHDLTGHKLLNFSSFIESASFTNPEEQIAGMHLLNDLKDQLRKLSHRFKRNWLEKFSFDRNIEAICRESIHYSQINLSYAQPEQYPELSEECKIHLYRIIQELLTNAAKYAKKARIVLDISLEREHLMLRYADDGPGFDRIKVLDSGIGIINIHERIRLMNGEVVLDARPGFGVSWEISIPYNFKKSLLDKLSEGGA